MTLRQFMEAKGWARPGVQKCHCPMHGADRKASAMLNDNNIFCFVCNRTYGLYDFQQAFGIVLDHVSEDGNGGKPVKAGYAYNQVLFEYPFKVA